MKLLIVGGGFTGAEVGQRALAGGGMVTATTRSEARARELLARGITPLVLTEGLSGETLAAGLTAEWRVLVTIPPDGETDQRIVGALRGAGAIVYVSSTAVYGNASGRVDEGTPVDARAPRAGARLTAEGVWGEVGATIVRVPAIYGPGRGIHLRLARGEVRAIGEGGNAISRVHVEDLAEMLYRLLLRGTRGGLFVAGDREPAPHVEVVRWVATAIGVAMPPPAAAAEVDETLRHDRRVDPSRLLAELGMEPRYPSYREGYAHSIAMDRKAIEGALVARGLGS